MKEPLETAVQSALSGLGRDRRRRALVDAFQSFSDRRFHGGAEMLRAVHKARSDMARRPGMLTELAPNQAGPYDAQPIGEAAEHSAPANLGRLLYSLVRAHRPERLLELGTSIGISAAYMAVAVRLNHTGRLVTIDASRPRLILAEELLSHLGLQSVGFVCGEFSAVLADTIESLGGVDFAFIDGDHQRASTIRYFEAIVRSASSGALILLDDIRWSTGMLDAWESVSRHRDVRHVMDLGRVGLILVR